MGFNVIAHGLVLIGAAASIFTVSMASRGSDHNHTYWGPKNHSRHQNNTKFPNKIIVGGSDHWRFGFNYSFWACQNAPFYVNDALVFKYDAPKATVFPQCVYMLPDLWSYLTCNLSKAKMIANTTQGGGEGFEFVLKKWQPYFFSCGERGGLHCKDGMMKFIVKPLFHRWHH